MILAKKAAQIRKETGDSRYYAPIERTATTWRARLNNILGRPFRVLFTEPMLMVITLYMSVRPLARMLFGRDTDTAPQVHLWMRVPAFRGVPHRFLSRPPLQRRCLGPYVPTAFCGRRAQRPYCTYLSAFFHASPGFSSSFAFEQTLFYFNPRYQRYVEEFKPNPVPPERRLEMACVGGPMIVIGFFWFGWTSYPSISFWAPMMAGSFLGCSVILIFVRPPTPVLRDSG